MQINLRFYCASRIALRKKFILFHFMLMYAKSTQSPIKHVRLLQKYRFIPDKIPNNPWTALNMACNKIQMANTFDVDHLYTIF